MKADDILLTGTDARRVMAGEIQTLWEEKTGRRQPDDLTWNLAAQIGIATEEVNRRWFAHKTGAQVYSAQAVEPKPAALQHFKVIREDHLGWLIANTSIPWIGGHCDGLVFDGREYGVLECKHTAPPNEFYPAEKVVETNYWQGVHYCMVTELPFVEFSVLYGNSSWDHFRIEPTADEVNTLLGSLSALRKAIQSDKPPEPRAVVPTGPVVARNRAYGERDIAKLPFANQFGDLAATIVATKPAHDRCADAIAELKKLEFPADAKSITANGLIVTIAKNGAKTIKLAA